MSRIGIYPGTFDPVHVGHIEFALAAAGVGGLDEVVLLPEANPREKQGVASLQKRLFDLGAAAMPYTNLSVTDLGVEQFTVDQTLPMLQERYKDAQLHLLLGSDVVRTFSYRWPGLDQLLAVMPLIIGLRGDDSRREITELMNKLRPRPRFIILKSPHQWLSSSQLRAHATQKPTLAPGEAGQLGGAVE